MEGTLTDGMTVLPPLELLLVEHDPLQTFSLFYPVGAEIAPAENSLHEKPRRFIYPAS